MIRSFLCVCGALAMIASTQAVVSFEGPVKRTRYPSLSPDGKTLAFSYQGDIFRVSSEGGRAERLTVHPAAETMPRFSPDGKHIAFTSTRHGNMDVFVMAADGSGLRRLTFLSANDYAMGWTPDSKWVLFYTQGWGSLEIMKVPASGGESIRLSHDSMEFEFFPSVSPDGKKMLYNYGGGPGQWRRVGQKGSGTADIWVSDFTSPLSNMRNLTKDETPQLWPMWSPDGRSIWYVADDGSQNLWRMQSDGTGARRITNHTTGKVSYACISANGAMIAYEHEHSIFTFDTRSSREKRVDIYVPGDQRYNDVTRLALTAGASSYSVSPNGKRLLLSARGEILMTPEGGGATKVMTTFPGRDEEPVWKSDTEFFYVTLQNGNKDVYLMNLEGKARPFLDSPSDEMGILLSPDRKTLAFHRGLNEVCVVPADGGAPKVVHKGEYYSALFGLPEYSWAFDSKHLAVTAPTSRGGTNIYLVDVETGKSQLVAMAARGTGVPIVTNSGKVVALPSQETETVGLWAVDLVPQPLSFLEDALDKLDAKEEPKGEPKIEVQERGLFERYRSLGAPGDVGEVVSDKSGTTLYATMDGDIYSVPSSGGAPTQITSLPGTESNLWMSPDGSKLYFLNAGRVNSVALATRTVSTRSFSASLEINQHSEAKALFDEIWWVMDRLFYDREHHGKNWQAIKSAYEAVLPHAFDRAEFYDLMQEMVHELNASHLGVSGPTQQPTTGDDSTGSLAVEPDWARLEATGEYVVTRVMEGGPADHPQSKLEPGDRIVAVNGVELSAANPMDRLLLGTVGKKVRLSVIGRSRETREVFIKPIPVSGLTGLSYDDFVRRSRALVDRYSGGQIAYLHIQGMSMPSHELFMRQVRTLTQNKKGLIIDVRYNGGGNTAHLALGMLVKRLWLIRANRDSDIRISENLYRGESVELPSALMINASSFSNAEILAEGFRRLGVGPVVGVATPGAVIGTASWTLFDGGSLRTPFAGAYTVDGENLEGKGRKPDIPVPYDPNAASAGEDPMLKAAVEALLKRAGAGAI